MEKIKKISVNAFENAMKDTYTPTETFDWNGIEVTVKKNLSLKEMLEFVDSVVKSCFTKDTNAYMPEIKDFATKVCILEKYANFTMPRNVETQYTLIYQTDAVERVLGYVNPQQFNEICVAIAKKVENLAQANIEAVTKQMNELYASLDNMQTQFSKVFDGIDEGSISEIINAFGNGVIDEEKLAKAVLNQNSKNGDEV